jgi:hypothetical protein
MNTDAATVMFPSATGPAAPAAPVRDEAPRPSTDADIARALYPPENTYRSLRAPLQGVADEANLDAAAVTEMHQEVANTFADLEVPVPEAREWLDLLVKHDAAPASDEQVRAWNREVHEALRARYGTDASNRLAAARGLIAKHPDFRQHLSDTGLASHPRIVLALVERAPKLLGRG